MTESTNGVPACDALEAACRAKFPGWDNPRHFGEHAKQLRRAEVAAEIAADGVMASDAPLPPDVLYDLAIQAGLGDELWFGKHMPKNPDYEDATPKLEKFAKLVRSYGVMASDGKGFGAKTPIPSPMDNEGEG